MYGGIVGLLDLERPIFWASPVREPYIRKRQKGVGPRCHHVDVTLWGAVVVKTYQPCYDGAAALSIRQEKRISLILLTSINCKSFEKEEPPLLIGQAERDVTDWMLTHIQGYRNRVTISWVRTRLPDPVRRMKTLLTPIESSPSSDSYELGIPWLSGCLSS